MVLLEFPGRLREAHKYSVDGTINDAQHDGRDHDANEEREAESVNQSVVGERGGRRTLDRNGKNRATAKSIALSSTHSYSPERDSRRGALEPIEPRRMDLVHYQADAAGDDADDDDDEGKHVRNEVVGDDDRPSPLAEEGHDILPRLEVAVAVLKFSRRYWRG